MKIAIYSRGGESVNKDDVLLLFKELEKQKKKEAKKERKSSREKEGLEGEEIAREEELS